MMIAYATKLQGSTCIPAGTTVTLTRQSEVDSFPINYPGCDVVEGDLVISGDDIVNLNGLISLKTIFWTLTIKNNSNLLDLNGLRTLEYIGNYFNLVDNSSLTSLNGLSSLASVNGGFIIEHNIKLINLVGLNSLVSVINLNITNNDMLISLDGLNSLVSISNIGIENNMNLKNIHALTSVTTLNGVGISGNPMLVNLDGLNSIVSLGSLSISDNSSLLNLSGLNSLSGNLPSLYISRNESLTNLTGLGKIKDIVVVNINNNNSLLNLEGLNSLKTVNTFLLTYNTSLLNLIGLDSLKTVGNLFLIERNQSLINLKGLDNLYSSESLSVQYNPSLINLEGLESFKEANFQFSISYNNSLTSLKGIGSMISGSLFVQYNSILTNVNGLDSIRRLNTLGITNNPKLENINGLNPLVVLTNLDLNSNPILNCCLVAKAIINNNSSVTTNIYGNDIGCSSVPEILALTPTSTCCITSFTKDTITICQGQNIKVGTHTYTTSGIYSDTIKIGIGCDSIIITNLTVRPKSYQVKTLNFCIGQSFTLSNGRTITTTGIYKDTIPNFCDSIIEYRLNFLNNIIVNQTATICQGKTYTLPKGNMVQTTGIYKDTLRSAFNCDSIVITNLTVTKPIPFVNNVSICKGKSYTLPNGNSVNNAGTYYDTIRKPNTCDSIVFTNLTVNPYLQSSQTATTCLGKNYTLPSGKTVTQSGIYIDTIQTITGCDSIVTTNLSITNPTPTQKSDSICEGKIYTLPSGKQVTNTGIYVDTIKKINTCDSVIITNLSVFQNTFSVSLKSVDTIDAGNAIELKPMYSNQPAINWNWSPITNLNCTTCEKPIATPSQNTQYSLKATAQNGCDDTAKTTIVVRQSDVYIPTAFSPNNDGVNDDLTVFTNNPIAFHLVIFNRYDQKVFESVDVLNKWNGTYKNAECEVDNYVYVLDVTTANGKQHHKQGTITLLR